MILPLEFKSKDFSLLLKITTVAYKPKMSKENSIELEPKDFLLFSKKNSREELVDI